MTYKNTKTLSNKELFELFRRWIKRGIGFGHEFTEHDYKRIAQYMLDKRLIISTDCKRSRKCQTIVRYIWGVIFEEECKVKERIIKYAEF